jgi:hypothetical protein
MHTAQGFLVLAENKIKFLYYQERLEGEKVGILKIISNSIENINTNSINLKPPFYLGFRDMSFCEKCVLQHKFCTHFLEKVNATKYKNIVT